MIICDLQGNDHVATGKISGRGDRDRLRKCWMMSDSGMGDNHLPRTQGTNFCESGMNHCTKLARQVDDDDTFKDSDKIYCIT